MLSGEQLNNNIEIAATCESLSQALYWMGEATLPRIIAELKAYSPEQRKNAGLSESLIEELESLERSIYLIRKQKRIDREMAISSCDLSVLQQHALHELDAKFRKITSDVESIATEVGQTLQRKAADQGDAMYDYEVELEIDFYLNEKDRAYQGVEARDDTLCRYKSIMKTRDLKNGCGMQVKMYGVDKDGSESPNVEPMARGKLLDALIGSNSFNCMPPVSLADLLRIGAVSVDIVARHQYRY
ncbi:hypothetical protein [Chitinibacter tainanensis]|uniref:hypothetical protein n=1 Tax=Chitinibacter tainanensis TaxID=230667 RepID=UPI0004907180|nr:hypothetical protein [Chitinibacter tainanensis]